MPVALVTGANRGLGLELVRQLLGQGYAVHATHRANAGNLADLQTGKLKLHRMDVRDSDGVAAVIQSITDPVDLLINNAAVYDPHWPGLAAGNLEEVHDMLNVNTMGPLRVTQAAMPLLAKAEGSVAVMMSTGMASISDRPGGNALGYRTSKAALNMLSLVIRHDLERQGTALLLVCPGWVATDMGGPCAPLTPEQSVKGILDRIREQNLSNSGRFVAYDGTIRSW